MTISEPHLTDPAYAAAVHYLYRFVDYERTSRWNYDPQDFSLGRVLELMDALGSPHCHGRFVHVAGTNGKGSVSAMVAAGLTAASLKTGLYTSPHLVTFRERIRIDGRMITPEDVVRGVDRLSPLTGRIGDLTFFEVWTALAFDYFARAGVDFAVAEVGIGGRLDSTNVIVPEVSAITSIALDHVGKLGTTVAGIAEEKAGIIKPGIPVVTAQQPPEAMDVIADRAEQCGAPLVIVGNDVSAEPVPGGIRYHGIAWDIPVCPVPFIGTFQRDNATVALAVLEQLALGGHPLYPEDVCKGFRRVRWPGRFHTIAELPRVILDGACNAGAMASVAEEIRALAPRDRVVAVTGICADKDANAVMGILGEIAGRIVVTSLNSPRGMAPDALGECIGGVAEVTVEPDPRQALNTAVELAGVDGLVIVTGSLYLVGEIMHHSGIPLDDIMA